MCCCFSRALPAPHLSYGANVSARALVHGAQSADHRHRGYTLTIQVIAAGRGKGGPCWSVDSQTAKGKQLRCVAGKKLTWSVVCAIYARVGVRVGVCVRSPNSFYP